MKALAGVSVAVAITLGLSAWVGSPRASAGESWPPTVSSSRLLLGGRVRCTATVRSQVQVGHAVSVRLVLHNVSRHAVKVRLWVFSAGLVLKAADGTTYNTSALYEAFPGIPPPIPRKRR